MGGIFGKNKRPHLSPKMVILYKARGKKPSETAPMFCDAATWTGENNFHSARIGRTPKGPEISATKLALDAPKSESAAQAKRDPGGQAASLHTQSAETLLPGAARDAQDVEVSQGTEAKPSTEVMQHQEPAEEIKHEEQSTRRSSQESNKTEAVLHRTGSCRSNELSCEDHEASPLTQTMVKADVHVSADAQGGPGKAQSAVVESELLTAAEQEAGAVCASEETCVGKVADSPSALSTMEESELPQRATETGEDITNVQRSTEEQAVEEQGSCDAKAPPGLQLEQDVEVPINEDVEENVYAPEQAEEMAEVCDDGQTSKENPCCLAETQAALQDEEIKDSDGEKPKEH